MMLALWNLLPAYPLDGGRFVRILFGTSMTAKEAVRRTVRISQAVAAVLFVYAGYVWFMRCEVLISVMLLAGMVVRLASAEGKEIAFVPFCHMAGKEHALTEAGYLPTMWYTVRCDMRAGEVIELFRPQVYTMVRVVSTGGKLCGTLSETAVWQGLTTYRLTDAIGIFCDEEE
jgi:stage IV sporulation protein FB